MMMRVWWMLLRWITPGRNVLWSSDSFPEPSFFFGSSLGLTAIHPAPTSLLSHPRAGGITTTSRRIVLGDYSIGTLRSENTKSTARSAILPLLTFDVWREIQLMLAVDLFVISKVLLDYLASKSQLLLPILIVVILSRRTIPIPFTGSTHSPIPLTHPTICPPSRPLSLSG